MAGLYSLLGTFRGLYAKIEAASDTAMRSYSRHAGKIGIAGAAQQSATHVSLGECVEQRPPASHR